MLSIFACLFGGPVFGDEYYERAIICAICIDVACLFLVGLVTILSRIGV